jgi:hypothetical protein
VLLLVLLGASKEHRAWRVGKGGEGLKLMVVWKEHTGVLVCLAGRYAVIAVFGLAS